MATVIDSLVVQLGLDPTKFTEGQKKAAAQFLRTRQDAEHNAKLMEAAGGRAAEYFERISKTALRMFAAFALGKGVHDFVTNMTNVDSALGRTAKLLNLTPQALSNWQGAAVRFGGSAEGMSSTLQSLNQELQNVYLGLGSDMLGILNSLQAQFHELDFSNVKTGADIMLELAKVFPKLDPARAAAIGNMLHLNQTDITLLMQGQAALQGILREQERILPITQAQIDAEQRYQNVISDLDRSVHALGRTFAIDLIPYLSDAAEKFKEFWINQRQGIEYLKTGHAPDWIKKVGEFLGFSGEAANTFAERFNTTGIGTDAGVPLRTKVGVGAASPVVSQLAETLQAAIPELKQFTAFADAYHTGGAHAAGRALDFTITDPSKSAEVTAAVRAKLAAMGLSGTVIDEYLHPSATATGGHIHVGLPSLPFPGGAAPGAGVATSINNNTRTNSSVSTSETRIGAINLNGTGVTDARTFAGTIRSYLDRSTFAAQADGGLQ